jgi:hypothetical protein
MRHEAQPYLVSEPPFIVVVRRPEPLDYLL